MQDGIIKGTGNSRYLKSISNFLTQYPTYQDFVAALVAGTLPIDLNGINETGWDQLGTALNKANLLSDETATALGLPSTAVPDDALGVLADFVSGDGYVKRTLLNEYTADGSTLPQISLVGLDIYKTYVLQISTPYGQRNNGALGLLGGRADAHGVNLINGNSVGAQCGGLESAASTIVLLINFFKNGDTTGFVQTFCVSSSSGIFYTNMDININNNAPTGGYIQATSAYPTAGSIFSLYQLD